MIYIYSWEGVNCHGHRILRVLREYMGEDEGVFLQTTRI